MQYLKFALFLIPFVQQGGAVFASEDKVNNIAHEHTKKYIAEDFHPYKEKSVLSVFGISSALSIPIEYDCYPILGEITFDIDKDEWIENFANLHFSNVRSRNAAKNRINNNNIAKWTYD